MLAPHFYLLRRYDESIADLDAALKARAFDKEKEMQIRLFYGNLLFLQERYGEAALQFEKTLEKEDVSPLPRRLYANVLYKKGDIVSIKSAEQEIKTVLKEFPADVDSYILLSDIEYELKDTKPRLKLCAKRRACRLITPLFMINYTRDRRF